MITLASDQLEHLRELLTQVCDEEYRTEDALREACGVAPSKAVLAILAMHAEAQAAAGKAPQGNAPTMTAASDDSELRRALEPFAAAWRDDDTTRLAPADYQRAAEASELHPHCEGCPEHGGCDVEDCPEPGCTPDLPEDPPTLDTLPLATPEQEALAEEARKGLPPASDVFGEPALAVGEIDRLARYILHHYGHAIDGSAVDTAIALLRQHADERGMLADGTRREMERLRAYLAANKGHTAAERARHATVAALLDIADAALALDESRRRVNGEPTLYVTVSALDALRVALAGVRP